jgi:hypothetical protein
MFIPELFVMTVMKCWKQTMTHLDVIIIQFVASGIFQKSDWPLKKDVKIT